MANESKDLVAEALGEFAASKLGDASGLVAAMIQQNYDNYAHTTQQLMESFERQAKEAQAVLDLIRADITAVFESPHMPAPWLVQNCLWPGKERVEELLEERKVHAYAEAYSPFRKYYA